MTTKPLDDYTDTLWQRRRGRNTGHTITITTDTRIFPNDHLTARSLDTGRTYTILPATLHDHYIRQPDNSRNPHDTTATERRTVSIRVKLTPSEADKLEALQDHATTIGKDATQSATIRDAILARAYQLGL